MRTLATTISTRTVTVLAAARTVGLSKVYGQGETRVVALDNVSIDFADGEFTAIMGPSGSGKSTLLHCAAALDSASAGQVFLGDVELGGLKDKALTQLRRDRIGFIVQSLNLVPTLSARENILLPLAIAGRQPEQDFTTWSSRRWGCVTDLTTGPRSSPVASSSGSPVRGRCSAARRSSSPTSRRAISTQCPAWRC